MTCKRRPEQARHLQAQGSSQLRPISCIPPVGDAAPIRLELQAPVELERWGQAMQGLRFQLAPLSLKRALTAPSPFDSQITWLMPDDRRQLHHEVQIALLPGLRQILRGKHVRQQHLTTQMT